MNVKKLAFGGILAAAYVVITLLTSSLAYNAIQFRVAEALCVLCFFSPSAVWGLTLGCAIANLFSPIAIIDVPVGTLATLIGCLLITKCKHPALVPIPVILSNAILVGLELALMYTPDHLLQGFLLMGAEVAIGETAVLYVLGLPLLLMLQRQPSFKRLYAL